MDLNAALSRSVLVIKNVTDQDAGLLEHLRHSASCYARSYTGCQAASLTVSRIYVNANYSYTLLGFDADTDFIADDDLFSDLLSFCLVLLCKIARLSSTPFCLSSVIGNTDSELIRKTVDHCSEHFRYPMLDHQILFGLDLKMTECLLVLGTDNNHV